MSGQHVAIERRTASGRPRVLASDIERLVLPPLDAVVRLNVERARVVWRKQPESLSEGGLGKENQRCDTPQADCSRPDDRTERTLIIPELTLTDIGLAPFALCVEGVE